MVRHAPAELLSHLVTQRLAALGIVGAHVDVDEGPVVVVAHLAAQPVHFVVGAFHRYQRRVVHRGADDLAALQISRNEYHRVDPRPRGMGGHTAGQVPGAGARQGFVAELNRLCSGD